MVCNFFILFFYYRPQLVHLRCKNFIRRRYLELPRADQPDDPFAEYEMLECYSIRSFSSLKQNSNGTQFLSLVFRKA